MKSKIAYYINPIDVDIRMLKFNINEKILGSEKVNNFITHTINLCDQECINTVEDLLCSDYDKENTVRSYLYSFGDNLQISDLQVCKSPTSGEYIFPSKLILENEMLGSAIIYTTKDNNKKIKDLINELLLHIAIYKPLVIYKNQLLKSIVEEEMTKSWVGNKKISIKNNFEVRTVLECQKLLFSNTKNFSELGTERNIGSLLSDNGIYIIDYIYI